MTYRAVLFDAGGTLLFLDYPRLAEGVGAACGLPLTAATLEACAPAAARELEREAGTDRERAGRYLEALFLGAGVPADRWSDARAALYALHRECHLWSGGDARTGEALGRLRERGVRLGVVSNSDGRVDEALTAAGLRDYFEVVVDSGVAGIEKPDPRIFALALAQLGVAASETLYVGDVHEVDVVGARRAGMAAALVGVGEHETAKLDAAGVQSAATVADLVDHLLATGQLPPIRPQAGT